ncbi:Flagellar hook-associated protein 2 [Sulfidibacter corallicola]|uniref:Flagellar hook-associated protein 2 n=1 Tax=Sulfidibacter corallicola TaxID=2818388 RepID=A0A8A4TUS6_SULCO|nr:flagellar filament capping protein FliD [Sulfidibacter corallicola]QTD53270.1 flagellar filament capping protein FliD [Sulfidibacter corallicola]
MAGTIAFQGLATGLDYEALKDALLVRHENRVARISQSISDQDRTKAGLSDLKRTLDAFGSIASDLESKVFEKRKTESSDTSVFTATSTNSEAATGNYEIFVNQLASNSVATFGSKVGSLTEVIGAGTLNVELSGGETFSVNLTDANSTITDLRQAINDQHGDKLNANIVEVESGQFQLVVSTIETGSASNIVVGAGQSEISGFNASFLTDGVSQTRAGLDAIIEVDGLQNITRSSNTISDVIEGITLTLKNESEVGSRQTLSVETDFDEMISGLNEFVSGYNDLLSQVDRLTDSEENGVLAGDSSTLALAREVRSLITRAVPNIDQINVRDDGSTGFTALSQIGFKSDRTTGELSIDSDTLKEALTDHFDEVKNLFLGATTSSNNNVSVSSNLTDPPFSGSITLDSQNDTATIDGQVYNLERSGSILSFASGSSFSGLTFVAGASATNISIEVAAGLGSLVESIADQYAGFSGIIDDRSASIDERTRQLNRDLDAARNRVEDERSRLDFIFARAEQAVSQLQGLQSSLGTQANLNFG